MNNWFYVRDGERRGPVSESELKNLAGSGRLERSDLIWKEGMADWLPASSEPGLFAALPPPVPGRPAAPQPSTLRPSAAERPFSGPGEPPRMMSRAALFAVAAATIVALGGAWLFGGTRSGAAGGRPTSTAVAPAAAAPLPQGPDALLARANECYGQADFGCSEKAARQYLAAVPDDARAMAMLGGDLYRLRRYADAIETFEKAFGLGWASYDAFAFYAASLAGVGRVEDSIKWNYRALVALPNLVDVRGTLAQQLVTQGRADEALALLSSFDDDQAAKKQPGYFAAQRILVEDALEKQRGAGGGAKRELMLARLDNHFYAPVKIGQSRYSAFMIDTGASSTTLSNAFLASSQAAYAVLDEDDVARLADGSTVKGRRIRLLDLRVGEVALKNLDAFVCNSCDLLLGQTALRHFDLKSMQVAGVEFLKLGER